LSVRIHDQDGVVAVRVLGEVDLSTCEVLRDALDAAMAAGADDLSVDLTGATFIDSAGLHCLLEGSRKCGQLGMRFDVVVVDDSPPLKLLRLTGTDAKYGLTVVKVSGERIREDS
jgi:anti-sigma B factor antagonist